MTIQKAYRAFRSYWERYQFLLTELIKRDFKRKYSRAVLGVMWSTLNPLFSLLIMRMVFYNFFGYGMEHYTIYLFCGNLLFSFFSEATKEGVTSIMGNSILITKISVPKYIFLISKNVQTLLNFLINLVVFFMFCMIDHVVITWKFVFLIYPVFILFILNVGIGLGLATSYVFFRDVQYFWTIFIQLLSYLSAIFYTVTAFPPDKQKLFFLNPIYVCIYYFRTIILDGKIPSLMVHLEMFGWAVLLLGFGVFIYQKNKNKLVYYM